MRFLVPKMRLFTKIVFSRAFCALDFYDLDILQNSILGAINLILESSLSVSLTCADQKAW